MIERVRDAAAVTLPLLLIAAGIFALWKAVTIATDADGPRSGEQAVVATNASSATASEVAAADGAGLGSGSPGAMSSARPTTYVVRPGDTLWEIADRHYPDAQAGIRLIKKRNGLQGAKIRPGQVLILPG